MNSIDSMTEPVQNISNTFTDGDHNCTAIDNTTGKPCGEIESLKIIDEFQKLYENRIENVDQEISNEFDRVFMKLEISKEWIKNLREQNVMLVQIVEDLEQAACNRVKLLEQKLKQTSMIVSENLTKSGYTEQTINTLTNRVSSLQKEEEHMRQRIKILQNDIKGLLELIRRASQDNCWNADGLKFIEIQPADIPAPLNCSCGQEETSQKRIQSLKLQIEQLQGNERRMIACQRELEEKLVDLTEKLETKEDTIKKYLTQNENLTDNLKKFTHIGNQTTNNSILKNDQQTSDAPRVTPTDYIGTVTCQENQVISYLTKVKSLMEQDEQNIVKLKVELENAMEKFCCKNNEDTNIQYELRQNIDYIQKICPEKKELIAIITSIILKLENNNSLHIGSESLPMYADTNQQCTVETQVITDNIQDEMAIIASIFKSKHQKYVSLNEDVIDVKNQLIRNREKIIEILNTLHMQEEEKTRHNERITSGEFKLKSIKDEMNHAQVRLSIHLKEMENNMQEGIMSSYSEVSLCNDLVCSVIKEIEQTSNSLQVFQTQECCATLNIEIVAHQLCEIESCIVRLQKKINEALSEHDVTETTLCQKQDKLRTLKEESDVVHSKIQHISETFFNSKEQTCDSNGAESQRYTQTWNEILQTKQDLHNLKKGHDELKYKMSQKTIQTECDDKCVWKCRVADLQGQVQILQHEVKCKQEGNEFLKSSIASMEEELRSARTQAENYKLSHSVDSIELKKKIIQLENTLKLQEQRECTLRQQLSENETELNKSKEFLCSFNNERSIEEALLRCSCNQFKHDAMTASQLFKTLESTIRSTKRDIQDLKAEYKQLIYEDKSNFCSSARLLMNLVDKLQKCEDELDNCSQEIEKLQNALHSKNKLIEDRDKMIKIQKEAIAMTQSEIKELHQKLQDKIDNQDQILSQYENEKKQLLKQNELQSQTIGHLQNAVVEAKRCIDQMGHKTMSDLQEKCESTRLLTVCIEETQSQYNECFAEAAKQEKLLELQREAIKQLQQKISYMEQNSHLTITSIHFSILKSIQEQLETRVNDIQALKHKVDTLVQSNCCSENKHLNMTKWWQDVEGKLQEMRRLVSKCAQKVKTNEDKECQCKIEVADKSCTTQDVINFNNTTCNDIVQFESYLHEHELQSELDTLIRENEDMKRQLEKYKLDFDIIDKELKIERENESYAQQISFELQKMRDTECCLRYENEQLKTDLKKSTSKAEDLLEKMRLFKDNDIKFEKLLKKLEDKQTQINNFYKQVKNNEIIMKRQTETIEELEKKLLRGNVQIQGYLTELNDAEEEMSTLHDRIQSLKNMLIEKSNDMTKLQADYEILKNDNSILKMENNAFENKSKEDVCMLKNKFKEIQKQLCCTEMNYRRVTEDFHEAQQQLVQMTKREADLQEYLTNMEKEYCLKISNMENEKANLTDCLSKFKDEFENVQGNYLSKTGDHCKLQDICKSYAEQLDMLQQQVEKEQEQLKECMEENCLLIKEKAMVEQNNCEIISELQETHKSLLELRKEYQLKNKSLACISAELTETAKSRSELCNQSQYIVSCIRMWMVEQRDYVNKLSSKLKCQQQQLRELEFEKKALLDETKKLKRSNHLLIQRFKRMNRYNGKNIKNVCIGCHMLPSAAAQNPDTVISTNSKYLFLQKKSNPTKATRRVSTCGNNWWFPKMKYLTNELRKSNIEYEENFCNRGNSDSALEESRDCGYQSSASK
ncbi:uncharacterized protein LOC143209435 [Lasioglossum baleicum]|uniref:uncharacterized protein LOC143209435 n=1 Tax=Lasioglossum baleicum TaxID=434251 RepID=UPI003FCD4BA1